MLRHHCINCGGGIYKPWQNKKYCGSCRLRERREAWRAYYYGKARKLQFKGCADCGVELADHRLKRCPICLRKSEALRNRNIRRRIAVRVRVDDRVFTVNFDYKGNPLRIRERENVGFVRDVTYWVKTRPTGPPNSRVSRILTAAKEKRADAINTV